MCFGSVTVYVPNFEQVEGAYWFGPVRGCVRLCVRVSVTLAYGQERLKIGS